MGYRTGGGLGSGYGDGIILEADDELPIYDTIEHNFYRVVPFNENLYGRTIQELHDGNLRTFMASNRYSNLLSGTKVSYWSNSKEVAKKEALRHRDRNYLLFWAYDDASSTFPLHKDRSLLRVIDGTRLQFDELLKKIDNSLQSSDNNLTENDIKLLQIIKRPDIDCLAYSPHAISKNGAVNFVFSENGFKKLAIREVSLYLHGKNRKTIECAYGSDFSPDRSKYSHCFEKIARERKKEGIL